MIIGAPPGFMRYETDDYPAECVATIAATLPDSLLDEVNETNRFWNQRITPMSDAAWLALGAAEMNHWRILEAAQPGVCHDFAVTKRHAITHYAAPGALSLAYCHRAIDAGKLNHLVLLVNFESGVRVLDNLFFDFYPLADCDYEMISRQTWGNPQQWESF